MRYVTCSLFAFVAMAFGQATAPDAATAEALARTVHLTAQLPNQPDVFIYGIIWKPGFVVAPVASVPNVMMTGEKDVQSLTLVAADASHFIGLFHGDPKNLGSSLAPMKLKVAPPAIGEVVRIWGQFGWQNGIVTAAEENDMLVVSTINVDTLSGAVVYKDDVFVGMVLGRELYVAPSKGVITEVMKFPSTVKMVSAGGMLQKLLAQPKAQPLRRPVRAERAAIRQ